MPLSLPFHISSFRSDELEDDVCEEKKNNSTLLLFVSAGIALCAFLSLLLFTTVGFAFQHESGCLIFFIYV
jgi:hypothetical protein